MDLRKDTNVFAEFVGVFKSLAIVVKIAPRQGRHGQLGGQRIFGELTNLISSLDPRGS